MNRFQGTTQVYCLRKDFLELTGKTRSGPGKSADAETVTGGLDLARRAENPRNLGRAILLNPSLSLKIKGDGRRCRPGPLHYAIE